MSENYPEIATSTSEWKLAIKEKQRAIVVRTFVDQDNRYPGCLKLLLGDFITIEKTCSDWYYGHYQDSNVSGVFPKSVVKLIKCDESESENFASNSRFLSTKSTKPNVVSEVHRTLKRWKHHIEQLYTNEKCETLNSLLMLTKDLMSWRRQIVAHKLPLDELNKLKTKISRKIDVGNRTLNLDLVLRDENGNIVDAESCSDVVELFNLHCASVFRVNNDLQKRNTYSTTGAAITCQYGSCCVLLSIHEFFLRANMDVEIFVSFYDAQSHTYLSEQFSTFLPMMSEDGQRCNSFSSGTLERRFSSTISSNLNGTKILFTDFGKKDFEANKIFLVCKVVKFGSFEYGTLPRKPSSTYVRQPYAVGVMDLAEFLNSQNLSQISQMENNASFLDDGTETQSFMTFEICDNKVEETLQKMLETRSTTQISSVGPAGSLNWATGQSALSLNGTSIDWKEQQGMLLSLQRINGNSVDVVSSCANYFSQPPIVVRKLGFPDVISREDVRNDLYITLVGGDFKEFGKDKNIEVKACLLDDNGNLIIDSFEWVSLKTKTGPNFTSTVYYHETKPRWNEMFKLKLPVEKCSELHLRFTFRHRHSNEARDRAEKVFALAYIRLVQQIDDTALEDGERVLNIFKICDKKWDESSGNVSYLGLPSTKTAPEFYETGIAKNNLDSRTQLMPSGCFTVSAKDSFTIRSVLCSTSLTQNVELLGLLDWQSKQVNLESSLESLMKQGKEKVGADIIKFLQDILDVLFNIMTQKEEYSVLAFDALVYVISLVNGPRFQSFKPVVDNYLHQKFSAVLVHIKLLRILNDYIINANIYTSKLFNALKSLEYLMKFIVRSRIIYSKLNPVSSENDCNFRLLLRETLELFAGFFKGENPADVLKCQWAALKYVPSIVGDILVVYDAKELALSLIEALENIPPKNFTLQKLNFVRQLLKSELFMKHECRQILLPCFLKFLRNCMERNDELDLVSVIFGETMELLYSKDSQPTDHTDLILVVYLMLRSTMQLIIRMPDLKQSQEPRRKFVALLLAMLDKLDASSYNFFLKKFRTPIDLLDFVGEMLMMIKDLTENCIFPSDWFEMISQQNCIFLKIISFLAATVRSKCSDPFNEMMHQHLFDCIVEFVCQKWLQIEEFDPKKKMHILARYRDMRLLCAKELRATWTQMDYQKKLLYIPNLVGPILQVTLVVQNELRQAIVPIFLDMIVTSVYGSNNSRKSEHDVITRNQQNKMPPKYNEFEHEFVSQLDKFVDDGRGDESYAQAFSAILNELLMTHKDQNIRNAGNRLATIVQRLMRRLLEYRDVKLNNDCADNRMNCVFNLMEFYRDNEQTDLYIRYLYKLFELHMQAECENFLEAASTLKLHADQLKWTDNNIMAPDQYSELKPVLLNGSVSIITECSLKEKLYNQVLDLYDRGKLWEKAIEICKELQVRYEVEVAYEKMEGLLQKMAKLYNNIITQKRAEPEYFFVAFYGKGFPIFLQNVSLVFRGQPFERLADFTTRMTSQYPRATVSQKWEVPNEETLQSKDCQILQIRKVDTVIDDQVASKLRGRNSNSQIQWYYKYNDVQKFSFTRRLDQKSLEMSKSLNLQSDFLMCLEQTVLVTRKCFPNMLRFSPVVSTETTELGPAQVAYQNMKSSIDSLSQCIEDYEKSTNEGIEKLVSLKIQGIVNPAVMGGISNYEKTIFTVDYNNICDQKEKDYVEQIKSLIAVQIPILEKGLYLLLKHGSEAQKGAYEHMVSSFEFHKKDVECKYGRRDSLLPARVTLRSVSDSLRSNRLQQAASAKSLSKYNSVEFMENSASSPSLASSISRKLKYDSPVSSLWTTRSGNSTLPRKCQNKRKQSQAAEKEAINKRLSSTSIESSHSGEFNNSSGSRVFEISETITPQRPPRPTSNSSASSKRPTSTDTPNNKNSTFSRSSSLATPSLLFDDTDCNRRRRSHDLLSMDSVNSNSTVTVTGSSTFFVSTGSNDNDGSATSESLLKPPSLPPRRLSGGATTATAARFERTESPDVASGASLPQNPLRPMNTSGGRRERVPLPSVPSIEQNGNH